jgi:hypothetical protein
LEGIEERSGLITARSDFIWFTLAPAHLDVHFVRVKFRKDANDSCRPPYHPTDGHEQDKASEQSRPVSPQTCHSHILLKN